MQKVSFLDLRISNENEKKVLLKSIENVFDHGRFILGPEVELFENKFARLCNKKYGISVNSGTDALFLLFKALGIGPGDEVITTALSWIATANAIALTGATPVFADIRDDLNIDPDSVTKLINSKTKALLPVHYCGRVCDMSAILSIAKQYKLLVIEDASQAVGSSFDGKTPGSFGDYACFSLNPMKVFAACGEAGIVVADSEMIAEKLCALRYNGMIEREICMEPSINSRLDTIQAAVLLERLSYIENIVKKRRQIADFYHENLSGYVIIPVEGTHEYNNYYTYTIRTGNRNALMTFLAEKGVETKIHHRYLMSQQRPYQNFTYEKPLVAERIVEEILSLPCHEKMTFNQVEYVCDCITQFSHQYSENKNLV